MRHLTLNEVLELYGRVMEQSGGSVGIYDLGALESALAQPRMTFGGEELYPTIVEKASALIGRTSNAIALPSRLSGLTYLPGMVILNMDTGGATPFRPLSVKLRGSAEDSGG